MTLKKKVYGWDMCSILTITFVIFDVVSSCETGKTNELSKREKRQFAPVIPSEVKEEFKNYAKSYLNNMVTRMAKRNKTPEKQATSDTRARICAEVCQHRCLPSCEWSCCIKENIEEYRQAHLVKPLVPHPSIQRKSKLAEVGKNQAAIAKDLHSVGKSRQNIDEPLKDGKDCAPSCRRFCVPSCRFVCCQAVQVKGVLLL